MFLTHIDNLNHKDNLDYHTNVIYNLNQVTELLDKAIIDNIKFKNNLDDFWLDIVYLYKTNKSIYNLLLCLD